MSGWPQKLVEVHLNWVSTSNVFLYLYSALQHKCDIFPPSWCCFFQSRFVLPALVRSFLSYISRGNPQLLKATQAFVVFYSFWNLELFRSVIPDICLNVTTLQVLALEYLIALYPFVLILFSYFIIELYDRKVTFIVTVWKPFHKVLNMFQRSWDIRTSVIDSFATFFLL